MEQFEALWAYQAEDMKADAIAAAIKRSPTRQKLEKARDFILDRQKQYKQIEEDVGAMVDRKDIIAQAIARSRDQLQALQKKYESNPPQTAEEIKALLSEVSRCRDTIRQYEVEISRIVKETDANDKLSRSVRLEAANPAYPPIRFAGEMELRVFGVVTACIHQFIHEHVRKN